MKLIQTPSKTLWEQVAVADKNATFFHTPDWSEIITETFPQFKVFSKGVELDDGEIAILPMVATIERNRIFSWLESLYLGGYGGLISTRALTTGEVKSIMKLALSQRAAHFHMMGNPLHEYEQPPAFLPLDLFTHFLDLGKAEDVAQRISNDKRRNIKKAKEYPITHCIADTEEQFQEYFKVYENTLERWGDATLVRYPYALFASIFRHRSDQVKLWLALMDDKIVCGKIMFYHRDFIYYWHGSTLNEYLNYYPDPLLMWEIILDGCQKGFKGVDMGPSGGLKGVETYKEKFGAYKVPLHSYEWNANPIYNTYKGILGIFKK